MPARQLLLSDLWAKIFSLVLAVMIWSVVNTLQQGGRIQRPTVVPPVERSFQHLSITVMKSADDDRGYRVAPSRVDVTLRGPPELLEPLFPRDVQVFIDLTGVVQADKLVKRVQIHHSPGLTVTRISPPEVRVERITP